MREQSTIILVLIFTLVVIIRLFLRDRAELRPVRISGGVWPLRAGGTELRQVGVREGLRHPRDGAGDAKRNPRGRRRRRAGLAGQADLRHLGRERRRLGFAAVEVPPQTGRGPGEGVRRPVVVGVR